MSDTALTRWLVKPPAAAIAAQQLMVKRPRSLSPLLKRLSPMVDDVVRTKKNETTDVVLGVLGTDSKASYEDVERDILGPVVEAWGLPDSIILPAEGESSHCIQLWANKHNVPVHFVACDWVRQGRRAGLQRDARIQREATHLMLIQGPRSVTLSKLASRLHRKGRPVVLRERPGQPVRAMEDSV